MRIDRGVFVIRDVGFWGFVLLFIVSEVIFLIAMIMLVVIFVCGD